MDVALLYNSSIGDGDGFLSSAFGDEVEFVGLVVGLGGILLLSSVDGTCLFFNGNFVHLKLYL